jgi:2-amino-4,5-dihydroxy-6-oxo-7-(phosphonooxy)heptanoate synthase
MGRNIFQHPTPGRLAREIGDVVHGRMAIAA